MALTPELMRFLGYYLAEGHCDFDPPRKLYKVCLTFHIDEDHYVEDVVRIVQGTFPS